MRLPCRFSGGCSWRWTVKKCTQVRIYFWITVSADWAEPPLLSPWETVKVLSCLWKITVGSERNDTLQGSWEMARELHLHTRRKDKFVCIFVPLHNEWQVYGQSPQSLSKRKLFDMMFMFVCSDFRNICQHAWAMWNGNTQRWCFNFKNIQQF